MTAKQNRLWFTLEGIVMTAVAVLHSGEPWFLYPCLLFAALFFVNAWISWNPVWFRLAKTVLFVLVAVWLCVYIVWGMMAPVS